VALAGQCCHRRFERSKFQPGADVWVSDSFVECNRQGAVSSVHVTVSKWLSFGAKNGNTSFSGVGPEAEHLSAQMMDAWLAFAKTGDPSHPGIGVWPAYSTDKRQTMIFGKRCGAQVAPFEEERGVWDALLGAHAP
jgi:carboxylesterase type B